MWVPFGRLHGAFSVPEGCDTHFRVVHGRALYKARRSETGMRRTYKQRELGVPSDVGVSTHISNNP
jgi:hypothetical protein